MYTIMEMEFRKALGKHDVPQESLQSVIRKLVKRCADQEETIKRLCSTKALTDVLLERIRQDEKWGVQNLEPGKWALILLEEIGEWAKDVLENRPEQARTELIQVAAVGVNMVECEDRKQE